MPTTWPRRLWNALTTRPRRNRSGRPNVRLALEILEDRTVLSTSTPINTAVANHFAVTAPANITAGKPFLVTVTAEDESNSIVPTYAGTVHLVSSDPQAVLAANNTLSAGVGTFSATLQIAGSQSLTVSDTVGTPGDLIDNGSFTSGNVGFTSGYAYSPGNIQPVDNYDVVSNPQLDHPLATSYGDHTTGTGLMMAVNGATQPNVVVWAETMGVVPDSQYSFSVWVSSWSDGGPAELEFLFNGVAIGTYTAPVTSGVWREFATTWNSGEASTANLQIIDLNTAGPNNDFALDDIGLQGANPLASSAAVQVSAAPASQLVLSAPNVTGAGSPVPFTVTAEDPFNNIATSYTGTVHFSSSDSQAMLPASATLSGGVGTFTAGLGTLGNQTLTANATPAIESNLLVNGNFESGNIGFTSDYTYSPGNIVPVDAYDVVSNPHLDHGAAASYGDHTTGSGLMMAVNGATESNVVVWSETVAVSPEAPYSFSMWVSSWSTESPADLEVLFNGVAVGAYTAPSTAGVWQQFTSSWNSSASSSATLQIIDLNTAAGSNDFALDDLALQGPYPTASTMSTSADITVNPGFATHFMVVTPTNTLTAGNGTVFAVAAEDAFNNIATGYAGTVDLTSSDSQAGLPPDAMLTGGIGYFPVTLKTAGEQTITAADTLLSSIAGATGTITVSAAAASHFSVLAASLPQYASVPSAYPTNASVASSFATTGTPFRFSVTALDPFGNTVPNYAGTVSFTTSDTAAGVSLPGPSTLANGVGVFSATLQTAGSPTITAVDANDASISGAGTIVTRDLVVTNFAPTPTGFTVTFNKPFDADAIALYTAAKSPDNILLTTSGTVVSIHGSLAFNGADTGFTFATTDSIAPSGSFDPGVGLLPAGPYTVTLRSYNGTSGFRDTFDTPLDGTDTASPGTGYQITFSVSPPPVAVGLPDFARGPSNTDAIFFSPSLTNGTAFTLSYTNPNSLSTGFAILTFSTNAATLQSTIQTALNSGGLAGQIGVHNGVPNAVVIVTNDTNTGANVLVSFQNSLATASSQLLTSTTAGVSISLATINVANNVPGNGIPIALSSGQNVTSASFTLQYNPSILSITGGVSTIPGATFSVHTTIVNSTSASAVISLSCPSAISTSTSAITLGSLLATVPLSAKAQYGATQLLHFSNEQLNGGAIGVTYQDAVQEVAYLGDVTGSGTPFSPLDATDMATLSQATANTALHTLPGFNAFRNLDPVIIGDVSLQGHVNLTDAAVMTQEVSGTARVTIPYAPIWPSVPVADLVSVQNALSSSGDIVPQVGMLQIGGGGVALGADDADGTELDGIGHRRRHTAARR